MRRSIRSTHDGDDKATLVIGDDDWPFPIPLVRKRRGWSFDTGAGLDEILRRRIGRNELSAIQVSLAYVQAQNEYASLDPDGLGPHVYAQRIVSSQGKKDGLYWPTAEGEEPSPLGDLAAKASAEGYKAGETAASPYHGYYYRVLKRQGASAAGGAYDYVVNGKMIGGFALIAYPAAIRQFRHHDLHGQSGRHGVSEGSRRAQLKDRAQDRDLRSGCRVEKVDAQP